MAYLSLFAVMPCDMPLYYFIDVDTWTQFSVNRMKIYLVYNVWDLCLLNGSKNYKKGIIGFHLSNRWHKDKWICFLIYQEGYFIFERYCFKSWFMLCFRV